MSSTDLGQPDRNLALELVRVTEAAALAAATLVGKGDKIAADQAAVDAMHIVLKTVRMDGVVVIGEGEKDEAPMLHNGEHIGDGSDPKVDIAVDPLEGTTLTAKGMPSALSVIALSPRGTMFDPGPCVYMEKMAGGPELVGVLDLDKSLTENIGLVAEAKQKDVSDVVAIVLDRPRHQEGIEEIRAAGGRVRLISDGDVSAAMLAASRERAGRPALGRGRHARGRHRRRRAQVPGRRDDRAPLAARRRRRSRPRWPGATTSRPR